MNVILDPGAYMPEYAYPFDAGADLKSPVDVEIPAGGSTVIDTGVHLEIPKGFTVFLKSKSGLNVNHGLIGEGVIDSGYTGSIRVKLYNLGPESYQVKRGDKIIQMVILKCHQANFWPVNRFKETERGAGGFGSTGR